MRAWIGVMLALVAEAGPVAAMVAYCLALPSLQQLETWIEAQKEKA